MLTDEVNFASHLMFNLLGARDVASRELKVLCLHSCLL